MPRRLPSFSVPVLCLLLLPTVACDRTSLEFNATGPAPLTASASLGASFSVEPAALGVEALPGSCGGHAPFGVRLALMVRGDDDLIVRSVRFSYTGHSGSRALPQVIPIPELSSGLQAGRIPSSSPVPIPGVAPLPSTTPIPIPGASPITGVLISPGSQGRFDYVLRFGCVIIGDGEIVVVIETADRRGRFGSSEVRVRVVG